jgi:hypothetical protein
MILEFSDEQAAALERELRRIIDDDRYPLSPRIQVLREIRNMIRPEPVREPLPDAHSGDCDRPFQPKVITDSGDRDHVLTRPTEAA